MKHTTYLRTAAASPASSTAARPVSRLAKPSVLGCYVHQRFGHLLISCCEAVHQLTCPSRPTTEPKPAVWEQPMQHHSRQQPWVHGLCTPAKRASRGVTRV